MNEFTQEDSDWFKRVQEMPDRFLVVIDNDSVWVEDIELAEGEIGCCVYTFNLYGYEFIYALLKDIGVNCDMC